MATIGRGTTSTRFAGQPYLGAISTSAAEAAIQQWYFGGPGVSTVDGDNDIEHAQADVIVAGVGFGDTQGTGVVELGDGPVYASANKVAQTVTAWAANSITITVSLGAQAPGAKYLFVTDGDGAVSQGRPVLVHRATAVKLSPSANISAGAVDATTARLTAPTGSFVAGDRTDDTNPVGVIALTAGAYTEVEASVVLTAAAVAGQTYEFRLVVVADDGTVTPPDTISATPAITVSGVTASATPEPIVAGGRRRQPSSGRLLVERAPLAQPTPVFPRRPLISRPAAPVRRAGRAIVVESAGQAAPARPRPFVSVARRVAAAGRAIIARAPLQASTGQPPRRPLIVAAQRRATPSRAILTRTPQALPPPRRPLIVVARRASVVGRVLVARNPTTPPAAPAVQRRPLVIAARARARLGEIIALRAPLGGTQIVSVPPAPQVTEPRPPHIRPRPAIVTRNRATTAPASAAGRQPLIVTSTRRPVSRVVVRRTPPGAPIAPQPGRQPVVAARQQRRPTTKALVVRSPLAPATPGPVRRLALVVAAGASRPLPRIILRRSPAAPAPARRTTPIVVSDTRPAPRRPTIPAVFRSRPPFVAGPGARARLPVLIAAPRARGAQRLPLVLGAATGDQELFVGGLNVLLQIQTLTRVRPASSIDAYGNTVLAYGGAAIRTSFDGWMQQDMRVESRPDGRNPGEQRWLLMCNLADLDTDDRIEWPSGHPAGPLTFAVEGPPEPAYRPPGTGAGGFHHVEATLRLLEG